MLKNNLLSTERIRCGKFGFIIFKTGVSKKIIVSLHFGNSPIGIVMSQLIRTITEITAAYATRREFGTSKEK